MKSKKFQKQLRHARVRKKVSGTKDRPRLTIFRSNKHIFAQIIDDSASKTLTAKSDIKINKNKKLSRIEKASIVGEELAKAAITKKIKKASFDRSGYKYNGRIKALAEAARKGGLAF